MAKAIEEMAVSDGAGDEAAPEAGWLDELTPR